MVSVTSDGVLYRTGLCLKVRRFSKCCTSRIWRIDSRRIAGRVQKIWLGTAVSGFFLRLTAGWGAFRDDSFWANIRNTRLLWTLQQTNLHRSQNDSLTNEVLRDQLRRIDQTCSVSGLNRLTNEVLRDQLRPVDRPLKVGRLPVSPMRSFGTN